MIQWIALSPGIRLAKESGSGKDLVGHLNLEN